MKTADLFEALKKQEKPESLFLNMLEASLLPPTDESPLSPAGVDVVVTPATDIIQKRPGVYVLGKSVNDNPTDIRISPTAIRIYHIYADGSEELSGSGDVMDLKNKTSLWYRKTIGAVLRKADVDFEQLKRMCISKGVFSEKDLERESLKRAIST